MMGAPGSPYRRKMRAVLRDRRIPFTIIQQNATEARQQPAAKVPLLPTFSLGSQALPAPEEILGWLRASYASLDSNARASLDNILEGSGREILFA